MTSNALNEKTALKIKALEDKVRRLEHDLLVSEILLEISNAVDTTPNLDDLFVSIHQSLSRLLDLPNIYISIYDRPNGLLHFPYFIDEADGEHSSAVRLFDEESLTGEVIIRKTPLFLDIEELTLREKRKAIVGTKPKIFIGVPLISAGLVIGVIAIQNYHDENAYTREDLNILVSVSRQIAIAIERKKISDALKENEERYRTLSEKSHDIIMRFDRSFKHLYVNPAIEKLGIKPEEMIGKTHEELGFPNGLVAQWQDDIDTVFESKKVHRTEFKLPNGIWIDWLLCPEFSADHMVSSVITFARDITERKQMEFSNACYDRINKIIINATDVEQMLNRILDAMLDIFQCDRAWLLYPCNPKAEYYEISFLRCRPEWYVAAGEIIKITPESAAAIKGIIESENPIIYDSQTGRKIRADIRKKSKVRSQIGMAVFPKTGDAWQVGLHQCAFDRIWTHEESRLFKGICQRISDGLNSMLLFRELKKAKNYIDNVVDSMPSVLIGVDEGGNITQWNTKAVQETGISAHTAMGQLFLEFFPHLRGDVDEIHGAINGRRIFKKNKIAYRRNGRNGYENMTVYPLMSLDVKGAVIRLDDVTEQMQLEEMMIQSEKMLSVGGLAAGMAHEINNPLAGMMQNAQVLLNRLTGDIPANIEAAQKAGISMKVLKTYMEERKVYQQLAHINEAGKRAATVVENMLSFARKAEREKHYEDLTQLLKKTVDLAGNDYDLKKRFDFKQIRIEHHIEVAFPVVFCEAGKIQQVFLNIIKNGAEAMSELIASGVLPRFDIYYTVLENDAVIRIQDNGPGMDEKIRKRVFEPFFTTKSPNKGTGLGLSVAYFIIVEDHGGELGVASSPGKGTSFTIKLPIHG